MRKQIFIPLILTFFVFACGNKKEVANTTDTIINANELTNKSDYPSFSDASAFEEPEQKSIKAKESTVEDTLMVQFSRTGCFGTCPIFTMSIYTSGKAIYEGKNFVEMKGLYQTSFKLGDIKAIFNMAENISFLTLEDSYDNMSVSDLPSAIIRLNDGTYTKKVIDRYDAPEELKQLEKLIDELILKQNWNKIQ